VREAIGAMVCGDDGFAKKPAPDAVFAVCHAYRTTPDRVAVVGDSPADVGMGRAAGAGLVVGVRSGLGSDQDLAAADLIIDSVGDLAEA
jgi:phosphoglycolate phosphatase